MQFSKKVSTLARLHNLDEKDVLFAMLATAGASVAESFAVIFRPAVSTNASLSTKASNHISQRPALRRLMDELEKEMHPDTDSDSVQPTTPKRKGRPRTKDHDTEEDTPSIDYTDKDALLKELARIAERSEKESDKLAALREIGSLQRMKQEAAVEDEKREIFYIPLSYDRCNELLMHLQRYYGDMEKQNE